MNIMRLDKFLSNCKIGSRNDIKKFVKAKRVKINGSIADKSDIKIDIDADEIIFDNKKIVYEKYIYLMLNKPKGVICSTYDKNEKTVIDILDDKYKDRGLFPVGRLDKDTVGLVIITNDGIFAHNSLSPKKHVLKKYFVFVTGKITDSDVYLFKDGIILDGDYKCKPAKLKIINAEDDKSSALVEISEGKFHQIKRMFASLDKKVLFLKRISFADIELDENLKEGQYRPLNSNEINKLNIIREGNK